MSSSEENIPERSEEAGLAASVGRFDFDVRKGTYSAVIKDDKEKVWGISRKIYLFFLLHAMEHRFCRQE